MKKCCTCKEEKGLNEFGKHKHFEDGHRAECKECRNAKLRTGKPNLGRFKKGHRPWCAGTKGLVKSWNKGTKGICKPNQGSFKKGNIPWNRKFRNWDGRRSLKAQEWAKKILQRDKNKCIRCESTYRLGAHHIIPWKVRKDLRFDMDNGLTLCQPCHAKLEGFQIGHKLSEESIKNMKKTKAKRKTA